MRQISLVESHAVVISDHVAPSGEINHLCALAEASDEYPSIFSSIGAGNISPGVVSFNTTENV